MLYNTYRPNKLSDVLGNSTLKNSLESMIKSDTPPQVYMFHGGSGTGKTTLARIVAQELKCENINEKNLADFRGIDTARQIISETRYKGTKCWIFDEAHQMTKDAQDALLKIFEDTPKHCYFILCTTEPNKVKKTIRSRCIEFETKPLSNMDMNRLLDRVIDKEDANIAPESIDYIVEHSEGASRKALTMLEQIINLPESEQINALDDYNYSEVAGIDLARALTKNYKTAIAIAKKLDVDPEGVRRIVLGYYTTVLINKGDSQSRHILDCFMDNYYDSGKTGLICSIYDVFHD